MNELLDFDRSFRNVIFIKKNPKKTRKASVKGGRAANNTAAVNRAIAKEKKDE